MPWHANARTGEGGARRGKGWAAEPWHWRCSSCGCNKNLWAQQCCGNCGLRWQATWGGRKGQGKEGSAWDSGPPPSLWTKPDQSRKASEDPKPVEAKPSEQEAQALAACLEVLRKLGSPAAKEATSALEQALGTKGASPKDPEKAIGPLLRKRDKKQAQLDKQQAWVEACEKRLAEAKEREAEISGKLQAIQEELAEVRRLLADEPESDGRAQNPPEAHSGTVPNGRSKAQIPGDWPSLAQQREAWRQVRHHKKRKQDGPGEAEEKPEGDEDMEGDGESSEEGFAQEL
jgi:hypothetical protein